MVFPCRSRRTVVRVVSLWLVLSPVARAADELPLLGGFHPDPSICRVGEDYYLATSSFTWYPGLPVYHSRDLRNWKICSHVLVSDQWRRTLTSLKEDSAGVYAPTIRHHGGRFYVIVNINGFGGVLASSARAEGPWEVRKIGGYADPSIFFDDDGACWELHLDVPAQREYPNDWVSVIQKFDLEKGVNFGPKAELPHAVVRRQVWAEGAHVYKFGKRYLMLQAEGGTGFTHSETAFWADAVTGPYLPQCVNPVLTRRHRGKKAHLQSTGHADLVTTPDGGLYAVFLGQRFLPDATGKMLTPLARETFMCPAEIDGNNIFFRDDELVAGAFEDPEGDFYESTMPGLKMKRPSALSFTERRRLSTVRDGVCAALVYYRSRKGYFALRKNAAEIVLEECRGETAEVVGRLPYDADEAVLELRVTGLEVRFFAGADAESLSQVGGIRSAAVVADDPPRNVHNGVGVGVFRPVTSTAVPAAAATMSVTPEDRARTLVSKMTLEEKASQVCNQSAAIPRLGIPACDWWNEALHGVARSGIATVFPQNIGRAATFDPELERQVGEAIGIEARAKANEFARRDIRCRYAGAMMLSPTVNLFRDPRWGRGQETFGEDPFLSGTMGSAFVRGLQGDDPRFLRATACAKHFAVHSGPEEARLEFDAVVTVRDLREYYLRPFRDLVRNGRVASVMCSYNAVNGVPATENRWLLTDVLRGEWGFRGYVITDSDGVWHLANTRRVGGDADCMCRALRAGLDVEIGPCNTNVVGLVRGGRLPERELDEKVSRLLAYRIRLGMLAGPGEDPYAALGARDVDTPEHRALARICAEKSLVLVKNDGVLPLDRNRLRRVCVTGPRALDELAVYGIYYGTASHVVPALSGIAKAAGPGVMVNDLELTDNESHPLDATVVCIGLNSSMEGEQVGAADANAKSDRGSTALPAGDLELLKRARAGIGRKPLVAVCFGGSPLDLRDVNEIADATILAWYPGEEGGTAIGKAIFGDINPAGRLPVTFPLKASDIPAMENYALEGRTYLYSEKQPLYPFGYGLSYTTFDYSDIAVRRTATGVDVSCVLANTGRYAGDEVVQVYLRAPSNAGDRRRHHLAGFARVNLKAGERRTVTVFVPRERFAVYGEDGVPRLPDGPTTVFVGGGQPGFAPTVSAETMCAAGKDGERR